MGTGVRPTLHGSASPFLRHGADQPVEWLPWGAEAFELARRENRPVLMDIGAVWCHWCHVMDRESYDDPDTAELINELFVPVKVDRDERPDVDARYQRAVQLLSGQGGWPLTAFLTPDGDVFYGGTYFPPTDAHGRPSFRRVLREVHRVWREQPERAAEAAEGIRRRLESMSAREQGSAPVDPGLVSAGEEALAGDFDFRHGGFGGAPKFPSPGALHLLLDRWLHDGTEWKLRVVRETLLAMARGGIRDHLGGGFHRYSVDARWLVPHFEKMAYDNGPLLEVYARAHAATGESLFREVAEGILAYYADVAPDLLEAGGFPASQDADAGPDDDGDYWTWTPAEIEAALPERHSAQAAILRFGVDGGEAALHSNPERKVLYAAREAAEVARALDLSPDAVRRLIDDAVRRMKEARDARPEPYVDRSLYTGWIGLVASGFLAAGRYLDRADAAEAAVRALDRIWEEAFDPSGIRHRVGVGGQAAEGGASDHPPPLLEDQAYVAQALLDAFETTQQPRHLERARTLGRLLLERFREGGSGPFTDRPVGADAPVAPLGRAYHPVTDSPTPAANAVAALALLRLAALGQGDDLRAAALDVLQSFGATAREIPSALPTYLRAVDWATGPVTTVVVVGGDEEAGALLSAALETPRPRMAVRRLDSAEAAEGETLPPELAAMLGGEAPRAYVCVGDRCGPPAATVEQVLELLRARGG